MNGVGHGLKDTISTSADPDHTNHFWFWLSRFGGNPPADAIEKGILIDGSLLAECTPWSGDETNTTAAAFSAGRKSMSAACNGSKIGGSYRHHVTPRARSVVCPRLHCDGLRQS